MLLTWVIFLVLSALTFFNAEEEKTEIFGNKLFFSFNLQQYVRLKRRTTTVEIAVLLFSQHCH